MVSNAIDVGAGGQLVIYAWETGPTDANLNQSEVAWSAYFNERTSYPSTWQQGISAYVETNYGTIWSGSFDFDWRPGGLQSTLIASGSFWTAARNPDGSGFINFGVSMGSTGSVGGGGPAYVAVRLDLVKLTNLPYTPTGMTATRVSDTQTSLAWSQSYPTNGAPTSVLIQHNVNGTGWVDLVGMSGSAVSATVATATNRKTQYRVRSGNAIGVTPWSTATAALYTTPDTPTNATADKGTSLDITVKFTPQVAYTEHTHEVWHGVVAAGVTTWDSTALTTLASGVATYTHTAPNAAQVHIYRVRAKAGSLVSGYATTPAVQLLAPPNKPSTPAMNPFADKTLAFTYAWVHNPVDTTPQKAFEVGYSTNGGSTWTSTGKVVSAVSQNVFAANTYAANTALTLRVRTWGSATTGGSDGTGASPWADLTTVTFKTAPTTTITAPANGSTLNDSTIRVTVGFTQPEAATFVKAQLELLQGATLLETLESSIQVGITLATPAQNGISYTVRTRVQDSNGLWSAWGTSTFNTVYLPPVPATVTTSYLPDTGWVQLDLSIPAPVAGQSASTTVTISRAIKGVSENLMVNYPVSPTLTILDTTPTINGTNVYTITTKSALGAAISITTTVVTNECRRAYLSKGNGYGTVVTFGGNLSVSESLSVASDTIQAAGRTKPIGLYGMETSVQLKVSSFMYEGFGSPIDDVRKILLVPGQACYRDASGRRVFGSVKGSVSYKKSTRGDLSFTMTETS